VELVYEDIFPFDALCLGDEILVALPFSYRKASLHAQFAGFSRRIIPVESARTLEEKTALIQRLKEINAEGFVAKELAAPYRPADNNQRFNYRYKFWKMLDAVVIGDSTKRVEGKLRDSVRLGCFAPNGFLKDICGSTKKSAFVLKPGDVVEIEYLYGTGTLDVVQPTILRMRDDKRPEECTLDQIIVNKNWAHSLELK
jgi:ATP-dependent DNA ligase